MRRWSPASTRWYSAPGWNGLRAPRLSHRCAHGVVLISFVVSSRPSSPRSRTRLRTRSQMSTTMPMLTEARINRDASPVSLERSSA